jgi:hypothetical protein
MRKIGQLIAVAVVGLGLGFAAGGCGSSKTTGKDKMEGGKMQDGKMEGGKMEGGKMQDGKTQGSRREGGQRPGRSLFQDQEAERPQVVDVRRQDRPGVFTA